MLGSRSSSALEARPKLGGQRAPSRRPTAARRRRGAIASRKRRRRCVCTRGCGLVIGAYGQAAITPDLAAWLNTWARGDRQWAYSVASIATLVTLTTFNVILGELMPKSLALQFPTQVARFTVLPMQWSLWVYGPSIRVLNGSGFLLLRMLGIRQTGHRHIHSPEELEALGSSLGLELQVACAEFEERTPASAEHARMQLVFERRAASR